jgi:spore photoproduct lyase
LLYIERGAEDTPVGRLLAEVLPAVPIRRCSPGDRPELTGDRWLLRRHPGRFFKPCPGTPHYLCCGYRILNLIIGCPFRCAYCILPNYYRARGITIFANADEALTEVAEDLQRRKGITRVGTGELADSLALESRIPLSTLLVPFFARLENGILELKTKSACVENLLKLPHNGRTVVSWSVNPPEIIDRLETDSAPLDMRLTAARACQLRGYPVGLHFDPLIWTDNWEVSYRRLVDRVFDALDPQGIIWISLGALRYAPSQHESLLPSGLGLGELVPAADGKLRYFRPLRTRMFRTIAQWLRRKVGDEVLIYLCMESPAVWRGALGWAPRNLGELNDHFQRRVAEFRQDRSPAADPAVDTPYQGGISA